jgi:hypothetical protein
MSTKEPNQVKTVDKAGPATRINLQSQNSTTKQDTTSKQPTKRGDSQTKKTDSSTKPTTPSATATPFIYKNTLRNQESINKQNSSSTL